MKIPEFRSYGEYSSENYGVNSLVFTDANGNRFFFSYDTLVAFETPMGGIVVHQNDWGTTTGKHLNKIDGGNKKSRLPEKEFKAAYESAFSETLK